MKTRLATLIAAATEDGKVDRAKLYESLQMTPDDPVAQLVEIFIEISGAEKNVAIVSAKHKKEAEETFNSCVDRIGAITDEILEKLTDMGAEMAAARQSLMGREAGALAKYGELLNRVTDATNRALEAGQQVRAVQGRFHRWLFAGALLGGIAIGYAAAKLLPLLLSIFAR